jgi:hypothetical protein
MQSPFEKFALPHSFQPRLTVYGALVAVTAALTQILLGCLIAALWGAQIWLAVASTHSMVWKSFATFGFAAGMAVSIAALLWAVQSVVRRIS